MRFSLTLYAAVLLTFGGTSLAKPIGVSNADLLARGEPIKHPTRLYDPSRTHNLVARASSVPTTTTTAVAIATSHTPVAKRDLTLRMEEERRRTHRSLSASRIGLTRSNRGKKH